MERFGRRYLVSVRVQVLSSGEHCSWRRLLRGGKGKFSTWVATAWEVPCCVNVDVFIDLRHGTGKTQASLSSGMDARFVPM